MLKAKLSSHSSASPSFLTRLAGMAQRNPWAPWSFLNYAFQSNLGLDLNRRLYPEKSLLPSYVSLSPTGRCNLKCKMCIQHRRSADKPGDLSWCRPDQKLPQEAWLPLFEDSAKWRLWKLISKRLFPGCVRCCQRSFT